MNSVGLKRIKKLIWLYLIFPFSLSGCKADNNHTNISQLVSSSEISEVLGSDNVENEKKIFQ